VDLKKLDLTFDKAKTELVVGASVLSSLMVPEYPGQKCVLFFDAGTPAFAAKVKVILQEKKWDFRAVPVNAGETLKDLNSLTLLFSEMIEHGCLRDSVVFALGGGTVGDVCGFLAGTFMRGIRWVGIPTTLLSQVDSCLGGKTGVNHPSGKNLIGVFHHPSQVVCETEFLLTVPEREIRSGYFEMLKYGLAQDAAFFDWLLEKRDELLAKQADLLSEGVLRSLENKARIVSQDPLETKGIREILNFGHSFGHAVEKVSQHKINHGEAVYMGMIFATLVSKRKGALSDESFTRIMNDLESFKVELPLEFPFQSYLAFLKRDKKNKNGEVRMVLLEEVGKSKTGVVIEEIDLKWAFDHHPKNPNKVMAKN
jgi:3-dehydroquinate synthase